MDTFFVRESSTDGTHLYFFDTFDLRTTNYNYRRRTSGRASKRKFRVIDNACSTTDEFPRRICDSTKKVNQISTTITFRIHYIQESGMTILFGALIAILIRFVTNTNRLRSIARLDPEFFFLILLPPIIFESGYHMKKRSFFNNIGAITLYALVGTTIATIVTGILNDSASLTE